MAMELKQTWDDQRLKRERLELLQGEMKRQGIGALYLEDPISTRYVLDIKVPSAQIFLPIEGEPSAFIRRRDMGYVQMRYPNAQLPMYRRDDSGAPDATVQLAKGIIEMMERNGVAGERLAVDGLNTAALLSCVEAEIHLTDATPLLARAQSVKTQDEVAIYHSIAEQYAHTFSAFRDALRPGISENELAGVVESAWYEAGGEDIAQLNVCSGENMNPWRRWPTQRTIKDGEFVGIDLHGRGSSGLRGDRSCTFFVGDHPTDEQRDLYRRAHEYLLAASDIFRSGRSFADVAAAVPQVPERYQAQLYNYHIGHGVGLGHSGYPHINRDGFANDSIQPNQVYAIECHFGEVGSPLAVKMEEQIITREGPPEVLSPATPVDARFVS